MAKFIDLTLRDSGKKILISLGGVESILASEEENEETGEMESFTSLLFPDGSGATVTESYEYIKQAIYHNGELANPAP
jgi:chitinase